MTKIIQFLTAETWEPAVPPPALSPTEEPHDEDVQSVSSLFSAASNDGTYDADRDSVASLFSDDESHRGNPEPVASPERSNEDQGLESLVMFHSHGEDLVSVAFPSLESSKEVQRDGDCGKTALCPPPSPRTGLSDKTILDETSLASVNKALLKEPRKEEARSIEPKTAVNGCQVRSSIHKPENPQCIWYISEKVAPRHVVLIGKPMRASIVYLDLDATAFAHVPRRLSMQIHLSEALDNTPCDPSWLLGPKCFDNVYLTEGYRDSRRVLRFIFIISSLQLTREGCFHLVYTFQTPDFGPRSVRGRGFSTEWCPEFSMSQPRYCTSELQLT